MEYNDIKEEILSLKLEIIQIQKEKNEAVEKQRFNIAAILFEREKQLRETLEEVRQKLESLIHAFELTNRNFEDFLNLQELLYEFYPIRSPK